jgi:hypothetical protein
MKKPSSYELRRILEAQPKLIPMVYTMMILALLHRKARGWIILACVACAVLAYFVPWLAVLAVAIAYYLAFPNRVISAVVFVWRSFL